MMPTLIRIRDIADDELDIYSPRPRRATRRIQQQRRRQATLAAAINRIMRLGELVLADRPISDAVSWAIIVLAAGFWVAMLLLGLERNAWRVR